MAKLNYTVRATLAPGETVESLVPVLVDRRQPTDLSAVIENAIDRSLIAGLKPSAAEGIADGIARQLAHEFAKGRSVGFGHYFYGRPYLSGTVDANGRLTAENRINVRLYKGEDFKLTLDDFSFSYEDGGTLPKVDFVLSSPGNLRGEVVAGAPAVNAMAKVGNEACVHLKWDSVYSGMAFKLPSQQRSEYFYSACQAAYIAGACFVDVVRQQS